MRIRLLEVAQAELDEAIIYYDQQRTGLGEEFLAEVVGAMDRMARFPVAWHLLSKRTRRCLLRRFPYGIIYQNNPDHILIVAVGHLSRSPEYWMDRIRKI